MQHKDKHNEPQNDHYGNAWQWFVSLVQKFKKKTNEKPPQKNGTPTQDYPLAHYTRRLVCATWIIAGVGILGFGAALLQWNALRGQVDVMKDQLEEAKAQRLMTQAQLRADLSLTDIKITPITDVTTTFIGWNVNPKWKNVGATDVKNAAGFFEIDITAPVILDKSAVGKCPKLPTLDSDAPRKSIPHDGEFSELAQRLSVQNATRAIKGSVSIFITGYYEYQDIYFPSTPTRYVDWCQLLIPNDIKTNTFSFLTLRLEAN
jgi:hypothetical protein